MGPSNRKREKSAPPASRMDAARSLLRTPPSPSPSPQVEWSSPGFTRARARPSNLHSYLRAGPSFPPSHQSHNGVSSTGGRSSASTSSGAAAGASTQHQSELRSQRTQATQTAPELLQERGGPESTSSDDVDGHTSIQLGTFGAVSDMAIDMVDFLIRVLEDRKQELLVPYASASNGASHSNGARVSASRAAEKKKATKKKSQVDEEQHTESSDESDEITAAATAATTHPRAAVVRSRSYEALVQLEGILEARHQQLMRDGVLESPAPSSANSTATSAAAHLPAAGRGDEYGSVSTAAVAVPGDHMMTDIQEEIRKMHCSLRRRRSADPSSALDRSSVSLFTAED